MNNPNFKHRNAYAINREDNSAEFDLYDIAGNVVDSFIVDLEDVGYIANYKWCKSQYGVENHKVKNLARFIAAQYIEDLKPTQSVIRIDERKLDYRKCNLRIGVTGSASKDSASRLATDAKKCEANGDYLHVYFAKKQNDTTYYRAVIASNNLTVGKFCVSKSYNVSSSSRAREYAIYTAYLFEKEYYGGRVSDHEYARKEKAFNVLTQSEHDEIASDVAPQLSELTRLRALVDEHLKSTSLLTIVNKSDLNGNGKGERSENDRYNLPCSGKTLRAVKEATERGTYTHLVETYKTAKSSPRYVASLVLVFSSLRKAFNVSFSIGTHAHAKEMAIYAAYLMEKVAYGDNFPKSEYDRKLEQIGKLAPEEARCVNESTTDTLEAIYKLVNTCMREQELKKQQLLAIAVYADAAQYNAIKSNIDRLAYGNHNRLDFQLKNTYNVRENLYVGTIDSTEFGNAWFAEVSIKKHPANVTVRLKFLSRTHGEKTRALAIYAAYLMEKTVYGTSIPGGEYEAKMLEILKLTRDDMFMVEKRVLPKLKELFNAVNVVCENKSEPELVVKPTYLSADEIESGSDEFLASIRSSVD